MRVFRPSYLPKHLSHYLQHSPSSCICIYARESAGTMTAPLPPFPPNVIAYQQAHIHENLDPIDSIVSSVLLALAVFAMIGRFFSPVTVEDSTRMGRLVGFTGFGIPRSLLLS